MTGFIESLVGAIALEEGFALNHRKARLRLASESQQLASVVVNTKPNYRRKYWDQLKAILHNCVRYGPKSQNRQHLPDFKAHLQGHIAHVRWLNLKRARKLEQLFAQIDWLDS